VCPSVKTHDQVSRYPSFDRVFTDKSKPVARVITLISDFMIIILFLIGNVEPKVYVGVKSRANTKNPIGA
jgi:hypothetical protein